MWQRVATPEAQPIRELKREVKALSRADEIFAFLESVQHLSPLMYRQQSTVTATKLHACKATQA